MKAVGPILQYSKEILIKKEISENLMNDMFLYRTTHINQPSVGFRHFLNEILFIHCNKSGTDNVRFW